MLHPGAWAAWLIAALVALSATRNPLYLFLTLLCIAIVNAVVGGQQQSLNQSVSPWRFAMVVVPLSALFTAVTAHFGGTVVLRLPDGLPVLGGPVTLEALVFGAINGLVLTGILAAFLTFTVALPTRSLIRLIPRTFYPVAIVVSIGLNFVPVTTRHLGQIREAQAVRGHRVRGLRDWLPLLMPLLIGGLERALQLAEAMTARGFVSAEPAGRNAAPRAAIVLGLVALLGGWLLRLVWGQELLGLAMMLSGCVLIVVILWVMGRRVPRTTYRSESWTGRDWAVLMGAVVVLAGFLLPGLDRAALFYNPYPLLSLPKFDPVLAAATLGLLVPAFVIRGVPSPEHGAVI
jgi:energy-coupling factor transport system permease protein